MVIIYVVTKDEWRYVVKGKKGTCKPGETSAKTGCTPASGESKPGNKLPKKITPGQKSALKKLDGLKKLDKVSVHTPLQLIQSSSMPEPISDDWQKAPYKEVPLRALATWQKDVDKENVRHLILNPESGSDDPSDEVKVIQTPGGYYLDDGNHRCVAAYLRGDKTIKARVIRGILHKDEED